MSCSEAVIRPRSSEADHTTKEKKMTRQRSILGALVLAALCFAALGASSASGAVSSLHECQKLPVTFTAKGRFNEGCQVLNTKTGEGRTVKTSGLLKLTATQTSNFVLESAPLGIKNKITCEEMMSAETTAENTETKITGEGKTTFSKCKVDEPAGCTVVEPIETVKLKAESEDL